MEVTTHIGRWDVARAYTYISLRTPLNFAVFLLLFWVVSSAVESPVGNLRDIAVHWTVVVIFALAIFLACVLAGAALSVAAASRSSGSLGPHKFTITNEGLVEETEANRTLIKWGGIAKLYKTRSFILVKISLLLFHLVPSRSFDNAEAYELFYRQLSQHIDT